LELHWLDEDDGDPETVLADRLKLGAVTLNEMRDHLGLDPYANPAADRAMVLTPTGYVPIEANVGGVGANLRPNAQADPTEQKCSLGKTYDPEEPRVPIHHPGGGRWTREGGVAPTMSSVGNDDPIMPRQQYANALIIKHPGAWTGDPRKDETTDKLVTVLAAVMETIEYPAGMSAQRYGQLVHQAFAAAVVAEGLPGIGPNDVETTFPEGPYGSPGSIRTDVVLRDDDGNIIAIYDVKTGEADLTPARANQLRAKTGAPSETPVIQVRFNEALSKVI
jgi:hypothetical protein